MLIAVIDEFGHEAAADDRASQQNPVFGYGGLLIPASEMAAFATRFFDFKMIPLVNAVRGKIDAGMEIESLGETKPSEFMKRTDSSNFPSMISDPVVRRINAKWELKGEEVFSRSYVKKWNNRRSEFGAKATRKIQRFYQLLRRFLKLLNEHNIKIIYCGFDKRRFRKHEFVRPHVMFIPDMIRLVYEEAVSANTTACIWVDRHHTDYARDGLESRLSVCRELMLRERMYDHITEPVVMFKSEESQCIQAADWICYLLGQILPNYCGKEHGERYGDFYKPFRNEIAGLVCGRSVLKGPRGEIHPHVRQFGFPTTGIGDGTRNTLRRPYHG